MFFEHHDLQRAAERHRQLQVEARILHLIRAAQAQNDGHTKPPVPVRRESLLARVARLIRAPRAARA